MSLYMFLRISHYYQLSRLLTKSPKEAKSLNHEKGHIFLNVMTYTGHETSGKEQMGVRSSKFAFCWVTASQWWFPLNFSDVCHSFSWLSSSLALTSLKCDSHFPKFILSQPCVIYKNKKLSQLYQSPPLTAYTVTVDKSISLSLSQSSFPPPSPGHHPV